MPKAPPLIWLPEAVQDLSRLRDFLQPNNPAAARRAAKRILDGAKALRRNPAVGRPLESPEGFRDLVLSFGAGAYVLRYRLAEDVIVIARVWHSREARRVENAFDVKAVRKAWAEQGDAEPEVWESVKAELGLSLKKRRKAKKRS